LQVTVFRMTEIGVRSTMPTWTNAELAIIEEAAYYIWLTHGDEMRKKLCSFLKLSL
jgi:hypothetical protein